MSERISTNGLQIASVLHDLVNDEIIPGTGVHPDRFWQGLADIVAELGPRNRDLLKKRDDIQAAIDAWHLARKGQPHDAAAYREFLVELGYLLPEGEDFAIATQDVDPEIATIAGPQLVVPVMNARYALNAANARWGSLYDALYGTDAIPETDGATRGTSYNPVRGEKVIAFARAFLDASAPLENGSYRDIRALTVSNGALLARFEDGRTAGLESPTQFAGFRGDAASPNAVLLRHNALHIEIQIDREHSVGRTDAAGIKDVFLESAITTIQDCEDSVAAVDAEDKVTVYRHWLGLMKGDLVETFDKGGRAMTRSMNPDREYTAPDGARISLPGRSLMLVRNVGHLMTTDAVLDAEG
jgi:malate synthase